MKLLFKIEKDKYKILWKSTDLCDELEYKMIGKYLKNEENQLANSNDRDTTICYFVTDLDEYLDEEKMFIYKTFNYDNISSTERVTYIKLIDINEEILKKDFINIISKPFVDTEDIDNLKEDTYIENNIITNIEDKIITNNEYINSQKQKIKYILSILFEICEDSSKTIYIVLDDNQEFNEKSISLLKEIYLNLPYFMRQKIGFKSSDNQYENTNQNIKLVISNKENNSLKSNYKLNMNDLSIDKIKDLYNDKSRLIADYIYSLEDNLKNKLFDELDKCENLSIKDLYNICVYNKVFKNNDEIEQVANWIYIITNPSDIDKNIFLKILNNMSENINHNIIENYLSYILSKNENICEDYLSLEKDLYKFLLFEDILNIEYKKVYNDIQLDFKQIYLWWCEKILPIYKKKYLGNDYIKKLETEVKEYDNLDLKGKSFLDLKDKIKSKIKEEIEYQKEHLTDFIKEERALIESQISFIPAKDFNDLYDSFKEINLKYTQNKDILISRYNEKFMKIVDLNINNLLSHDINNILARDKEYITEENKSFIRKCVAKEVKNIESNLEYKIKDAKNLKSLNNVINEVLGDKKTISSPKIKLIIFDKLQFIIRSLNLADINSKENIRMAQEICQKINGIDINDYPTIKILVDRNLEIDLNNEKDCIDKIREKIKSTEKIIGKEFSFNPKYYNINIKINNEKNLYPIKFTYLEDLKDYISTREYLTMLGKIKRVNKDVQFKRRVFCKANPELVRSVHRYFGNKIHF